MKTLASILALWICAISLVPCADEAVVIESGRHINQQQGQNHDHSQDHDHDSNSDNCSPFCTCQCCHTHTLVNQCSELVIHTNYEEMLGWHMSLLPVLQPHSIFHPPRV